MGPYPETEQRDGMSIDWDVPIEMDDGVVLRADVFRPIEEGDYPVIMSHGPYGKWLDFEEGYPDQWKRLVEHPDVPSDENSGYLAWETVDPEQWVPDDYAVVRVDSRGAGRSPGTLDLWSGREARDYAGCIEWAGEQPWSNGRVGLNGISYYAVNQWQVAALQPDSLAALCAWEGFSDFYREFAHHGGIYTDWSVGWYERQPLEVQHGVGSDGYRSSMTGDWVAGPETLTNEELGSNRAAFVEPVRSNKLATDEYWTERTPDLSEVEVPVLSAANWGGHGLHTRGNFEAFTRVGSDQKWLEVHGDEHWTHFYTDYGLSLQKEFFDHFLKGRENGWSERPRVQLQVRHPGEEFEERHHDQWPLEETEWTRYYLHPERHELSTDEPAEQASHTYDALGDGVTLLTTPLDEPTEITGPISARLQVSSDTEDADLFLVVRVFHPDVEEVVFQGVVDPHKPVALGWLRASHRKLDPDRSEEWRPFHAHDELQPLEPGEIYELDVEIWPTSIVAPAGSRIGLSVRGRDYEYPGDVVTDPDTMEGRRGFSGVGSYAHGEAVDRPADVYGGEVTIHSGPDRPSSVLLPIVEDR